MEYTPQPNERRSAFRKGSMEPRDITTIRKNTLLKTHTMTKEKVCV